MTYNVFGGTLNPTVLLLKRVHCGAEILVAILLLSAELVPIFCWSAENYNLTPQYLVTFNHVITANPKFPCHCLFLYF